jgi:hypothetical protein
VDEFVESNWEDLNYDLALESIKEEWNASPEEPEPVKVLRYQAFKLMDGAMALFDKHTTNLVRSSKSRDIKKAQKCYKEL